MLSLHGQAGRTWLQGLPALLETLVQNWSLRLLEPYDLRYNYVTQALAQEGERVVLKVGFPNQELTREILALRVYSGRGMVRLLQADAERGALLLEYIHPGTPLYEIKDEDKACRIAAGLMRRILRPLPAQHPFLPVSAWTRGLQRLRSTFNGGTGPFPRHLVEQAETLFTELLKSQAEVMLLHGDLHHWNILSAEREPWLGLDPKGVAGEAACECAAFLRNPLPEIGSRPDLGAALARRTAIFAEELGFERERILGWGMAQAVLSAWWSYEDHGKLTPAPLAVAQVLSELMRA